MKYLMIAATIATLCKPAGQPAPATATTPAPGALAIDPGPRGGSAGAGGPLNLDADRLEFFEAGFEAFAGAESVAEGLGPRFNLAGCGGCHAQPATGGTSPAHNPQADLVNAANALPWFATADGPVREVRDRDNGGRVLDIFVVTGRDDAPSGCTLTQPDFGPPGNPRFTFRIPTPVFGAGLIEAIPDSTILTNASLMSDLEHGGPLGIHGHPNMANGDDTISRFGWKAQTKSLLMFAGEAYSVEMGITNELFPNEREEQCAVAPGQAPPSPNNVTNFTVSPPAERCALSHATQVPSAIELFSFFMRFSAPPEPVASEGASRGRLVFDQIGCAYCHTPTLVTGPSNVVAFDRVPVNLFSDLLLHHMGGDLADGVTQGAATGDEFRTAPLWGVGQRLFFLHDGRATTLVDAIEAHACSYSEANMVVDQFNALSPENQQDLLDFLRSL